MCRLRLQGLPHSRYHTRGQWHLEQSLPRLMCRLLGCNLRQMCLLRLQGRLLHLMLLLRLQRKFLRLICLFRVQGCLLRLMPALGGVCTAIEGLSPPYRI